jgi:hypothetical protein
VGNKTLSGVQWKELPQQLLKRRASICSKGIPDWAEPKSIGGYWRKPSKPTKLDHLSWQQLPPSTRYTIDPPKLVNCSLPAIDLNEVPETVVHALHSGEQDHPSIDVSSSNCLTVFPSGLLANQLKGASYLEYSAGTNSLGCGCPLLQHHWTPLNFTEKLHNRTSETFHWSWLHILTAICGYNATVYKNCHWRLDVIGILQQLDAKSCKTLDMPF